MKWYYRRRRIYKRRTLCWLYGIALAIMFFNLVLFVSLASSSESSWGHCHEPSYVHSAQCDPAQPGIQTEAEMEQYWAENLREEG